MGALSALPAVSLSKGPALSLSKGHTDCWPTHTKYNRRRYALLWVWPRLDAPHAAPALRHSNMNLSKSAPPASLLGRRSAERARRIPLTTQTLSSEGPPPQAKNPDAP